jgi:hypothetical protein
MRAKFRYCSIQHGFNGHDRLYGYSGNFALSMIGKLALVATIAESSLSESSVLEASILRAATFHLVSISGCIRASKQLCLCFDGCCATSHYRLAILHAECASNQLFQRRRDVPYRARDRYGTGKAV